MCTFHCRTKAELLCHQFSQHWQKENVMRKYQTRAKIIFILNLSTSSMKTSVSLYNPSSVLKPQRQSKIGSLLKYKLQLPWLKISPFYTLLIKIFWYLCSNHFGELIKGNLKIRRSEIKFYNWFYMESQSKKSVVT